MKVFFFFIGGGGGGGGGRPWDFPVRGNEEGADGKPPTSLPPPPLPPGPWTQLVGRRGKLLSQERGDMVFPSLQYLNFNTSISPGSPGSPGVALEPRCS